MKFQIVRSCIYFKLINAGFYHKKETLKKQQDKNKKE